jgi:phospholipid transport system substrate-binding protein
MTTFSEAVAPSARPLANLFAGAALAAGLLIAGFAPAFANPKEEAKAYVQQLADETIAILSKDGQTPSEREAAFRELFTENLDIPRVAGFALGQYARLPSPEEKKEYIQLIEEFIVKVYANRLSAYTDQTFHVNGAVEKGSKGKEVIVESKIEFASGREPVPVDWWLLRQDEGFKVFDVKVLGIWMAQEQRDTFISVIRNNGGKFEPLLKHLRAQIGQAEKEIQQKLTGEAQPQPGDAPAEEEAPASE